MPFESPDRPIEDLLKEIHDGRLQLPDFQRQWKWDVDRITSLLASIGLGHPVGVVMTLETGSDEVQFKTRHIAGAPKNGIEASHLLLDGQQRLTSLYQALYSSDAPVETDDSRGKQMQVYFYLDIASSLDEDADLEDDAILAVPADRMVRSDFGRKVDADYSSLEKECAAGVFPMARVFDADYEFEFHSELGRVNPDLRARFPEFREKVLREIRKYLVPVIELKSSTPREAVCTVFEKVNTGGVALNVFELLTATFASGPEDFRLNEDWTKRKTRMRESRLVLRSLESTDFLQAACLLATRKRRHAWSGEGDKAPGISCKRKDILRLTLEEYKEWAEPLTDAFIWAGQFLNHQSVFRAEDVPYRSQLVPLAALRVAIGPDTDLQGVYQQLTRWYWCGVLGELYGGAVETRFARDLEQVESWVEGGEEPGTVAGSAFNPGRLLTLKTRNSAAYKGLYALTMGSDVKDWVNHQTINQSSFRDYGIDIHHIFPKAWCRKHGIDPDEQESIVNKTPLSAATNRFISAKAPSTYVAQLAEKAHIDPGTTDALLAEHLVEAAHLRSDDFPAFFEARRLALLALIEGAMGKPVLDDSVPEEVFEPEELDADDDMEIDAPASSTDGYL